MNITWFITFRLGGPIKKNHGESCTVGGVWFD